MKPLPELQRNKDNRFTYFMCKSDENQIDQTWGKKQPETTEVDLILVVLTLSGCVTAVGALAFSHYEGKLRLSRTHLLSTVSGSNLPQKTRVFCPV